MIAKLIGTKSQLMGGASLVAGKKQVLGYSWAVFKYVAGLELDEEDLARLEELGRMARYPINDKGDDDRIRDRETLHLKGADYEQRALAFAYLTAQYGENALKHITVSYGDVPVSLEMAERHRATFLRVLGAENCAGVYALHGDTDHDHWHLALCAYDLTNRDLAKWGQGFEIEALHIALALCERDDHLPCERNRRYVADETGVYHTLSGIKVANPDGQVYSAQQVLRVAGLQHKIEEGLQTPEGLREGAPVPEKIAIKILARAALETAHDWPSFHRGLARVGIRYQPYVAAGKIMGGHFVPVDSPDESATKVKASEIHAGFKKLVDQFPGDEFEDAPDGLWFRPFRSLGYVGKPPSEREASCLEREARAAEDQRLAALAAEIATRHKLDGLTARAAEKARDAKKRKREGDLLERDDDPLEEENAKYRSRERDMIAGLRRQRKKERGDQRGRPSKQEPVDALIWGASSDNSPRNARWSDRYRTLASHGQRKFYDNEALAFAETRNFVALYSNDRQHQIDALLLAQKKFGTIRIEGTRRQRRELVELAVELNIPLDSSHDAEAAKYLRTKSKETQPEAMAQTTPARSTSMPDGSGSAASPRAAEEQKTSAPLGGSKPDARLRTQRQLADLRHQILRDRRRRTHRLAEFTEHSISWLKDTNQAADDGGRASALPNPEPSRARRRLEGLDRNRSHLVSSRQMRYGYRFLDDETLQRQFVRKKQWLLLPDVQSLLHARAAIQLEERRWFAAALCSERITIRKGEVKVNREDDRWAVDFFHGQKDDPNFQALLALAKLAPERFRSDLDQRPDLTAWRRAHRSGASDLAKFIAHEIDLAVRKHGEAMVSTGPPLAKGANWTVARDAAANDFRRAITKDLPAEERDVLRKTTPIGSMQFPQFPWKVVEPGRRPSRRKRKQGQRPGRDMAR